MPETAREAGLLHPLDAFYERAGLIVPAASLCAGEDIPEPYRSLLVHSRDMTPTLERHYADTIQLRVIGRRLDGEALSRLVVLELQRDCSPVEFGAIVIHLNQFPVEARDVILECRRPLGTVLALHEIPHYSRPRGYIRVKSDPLIQGALACHGPGPLYGRQNVLRTPDGQILAEVLEILPPV